MVTGSKTWKRNAGGKQQAQKQKETEGAAPKKHKKQAARAGKRSKRQEEKRKVQKATVGTTRSVLKKNVFAKAKLLFHSPK